MLSTQINMSRQVKRSRRAFRAVVRLALLVMLLGGSVMEAAPQRASAVEKMPGLEADLPLTSNHTEGHLPDMAAPTDITAAAETGITLTPIWSSRDTSDTRSIAWGDVDNDGDLDLAVGSDNTPTKLYRNDNGSLTTDAVWLSEGHNSNQSIAWGDIDNDGDLDLAVGNYRERSKIYQNNNGDLTSKPVWLSGNNDFTQSIAWGDVDGDGYLDLAVGNWSSANRIYRNLGGKLDSREYWSSTTAYDTESIAWGDVDSDGDLDLAVGNYDAPSQIYYNKGGNLSSDGVHSLKNENTRSLAWGDVDGDGDLDLAVGNAGTPNRLYLNNGSRLGTNPISLYSGSDPNVTIAILWGDVDRDDDLDLIAGNHGYPSKIYLNKNGSLATNPSLSTEYSDDTRSIALGDVDSDGDLDLVFGNQDSINRLYRNDISILNNNPVWSSKENNGTQTIAWGDVDQDGDLDLAAGNDDGIKRLYLNDKGQLNHAVVWSNEDDNTTSMAWYDVNGDSYPELAVGNYGSPSKIYSNENGKLTGEYTWVSEKAYDTTSIAWGDANGDGNLDLVLGNWGNSEKLYLNTGRNLAATPITLSNKLDDTTSIAWGDVDKDGDDDLVVGNWADPNLLYLNNSGTLTPSPDWNPKRSPTQSVAWGDLNGDDYPELAVGNEEHATDLYDNRDGFLSQTPGWSSPEEYEDNTRSVVWGDIDGDRDPDLVVINEGAPNRLYRNENGNLTPREVWHSNESDYSTSAALGDIDGDGDLDLAVGNMEDDPNRVYRNDQGSLTQSPTWSSSDFNRATSTAWGDVDGDGDLDLAVGNSDGAPSRLYRNDHGILTGQSIWSTTETYLTNSLAWGDVDNDGDLDLMIGNADAPNQLYHNEGGNLTSSPEWSSTAVYSTTSVAWGDLDNDGDLDLAVGSFGGAALLHRNDNGDLTPSAVWSSTENDDTSSVAWGDVDGDGDLDLAAGSSLGRNRLYRNDNGALNPDAVWLSPNPDSTQSIAWGDVDGDGDLDLAVGNEDTANQVYRNDQGTLYPNPIWRTDDPEPTQSVDWGDVDGDGDLDLMVGNFEGSNRLYLNNKGKLTTNAVWSSDFDDANSVAWGDVDGDSDLDLAIGGLDSVDVYKNLRSEYTKPFENPLIRISQPTTDPAAFYSAASILTGPTIPISYTLTHPKSHQVQQIIGQYSLDGGGHWLLAVATPGTTTTNLKTSPDGVTHTYTWDVFASGVLGQSDNVVFRLLALPALSGQRNQIAGPFLYGATSSSTMPFRVRVSRVRVTDEASAPLPGALVYRQVAGQTNNARPYLDRAGRPWRTDAQGYLPGLNEVQAGDQLIALLPISATSTYTLYATSAAPTSAGLDLRTVRTPGTQTLSVSHDHHLMLFNLRVSLEWDARKESKFLEDLQDNLRRTSGILYDWSNGQIALGDLTIYHDKEQWNNADIRIYASNHLRPNAAQGGWGTQVITDPVSLRAGDPLSSALVYVPGQVRMGVVWDRTGVPGGNFGRDWPNVLAHELGHYLLYLDDNYLGRALNGAIVSVDSCPGAMSDPYRLDHYSEFHPDAEWLPACEQTLSHQETGRSDWATIRTFYPWLSAPTVPISQVLSGPSNLPLNIIQFHPVLPLTPSVTLDETRFYLSWPEGVLRSSRTARAVLFQDRQPDSAQTPDRLVDLGRPVNEAIHAYGARPGDRLCVYDHQASRVGCMKIDPQIDQLILATVPDWQPEVKVTPITSDTVALRVSNVPAGLSLHARLFPMDAPDPLLQPGAGEAPAITLAAEGDAYTGTFADLAEPVFEGYIQVWVDEPERAGQPRHETVTDFALGGNPGRIKMGVGRIKMGVGRIKMGVAPVRSVDGQAVLLDAEQAFAEGQLFALQPITALPPPPLWATPAGQPYQLTALANIEGLKDTSISITYVHGEVPAGENDWAQVYYWDTQRATKWQALPTTHDTEQRTFTAPTRGPGIYAVMSSRIVKKLAKGWNEFTNPIQATQPISEALSAIQGFYTDVYLHDQRDTQDPWKIYAPAAPAWVSDLHELKPGQTYKIRVTEPITLLVRSALPGAGLVSLGPPRITSDLLIVRPTTFYGVVQASSKFTPTAGMAVIAHVQGTFCGAGQTLSYNGQIVYSVDVEGISGVHTKCGTESQAVSFQVGGKMMPADWWRNGGAQKHDLSDQTTFLPLISVRRR